MAACAADCHCHCMRGGTPGRSRRHTRQLGLPEREPIRQPDPFSLNPVFAADAKPASPPLRFHADWDLNFWSPGLPCDPNRT